MKSPCTLRTAASKDATAVAAAVRRHLSLAAGRSCKLISGRYPASGRGISRRCCSQALYICIRIQRETGFLLRGKLARCPAGGAGRKYFEDSCVARRYFCANFAAGYWLYYGFRDLPCGFVFFFVVRRVIW